MSVLNSVRLGANKAQVIAIALPLAALFLSGCPIYPDNGHPIACGGTNSCPTGYMCQSGMCVPSVRACSAQNPCPSGQVCTAGVCVQTTTCETHGDCPVGQMCDVQACTASTTCHADADCTMSGFWCDFRGTCVPHTTGQCRTGADCTGGDLCIEGVCTHASATCQFEYDCPPGTACVNAQCTGVCAQDSDCVAGDSCNTTSHFCEPTVDCETSAMCAGGEHCVNGRCLNDCHASGSTCTGGAHQTAYCATGGDSFCHPSWQPAAFCPATPCAAGRTCLSGVCRTPCTIDTTHPAPGGNCGTIDAALPYCVMDTASNMTLCSATMSGMTPQCRTNADCTSSTQHLCVNAQCQ
jgi:hypothetical protein